MEKKIKEKKCFLQNCPAITALRVVFKFWPFFMCGVSYPNPGAPLHPGMFIFVSLRQCSSHLLLSASTYFRVHVLSACVICTLPHLGVLIFLIVLIFFVALILRVAIFFVCSRTRYATNWFAYFRSLATLGFSLSVLDHRICISPGWRIRKDAGGTADVGKKKRFSVKTAPPPPTIIVLCLRHYFRSIKALTKKNVSPRSIWSCPFVGRKLDDWRVYGWRRAHAVLRR